MTRKQWENIYDSLFEIESNLSTEYQKAKNGKNAKIRQEGRDRIRRFISQTESILQANPEVYYLLIDKFKNSDYQRSIYLDEFFSQEHFKTELHKFLQKMRTKINSLNQD